MKIFFSLIFLLFNIQVAQAHGLGLTFEKQVADYLVDVDYIYTSIETDRQGRFDFNITNKNKEPVPFTSASVRIKQGEKIIFNGTLHKPEFGPTGMSSVFTEAGEHEVSIRFNNNRDILAEASFPITVIEAEEAAEKRKQEMIIKFLLAPVGLVAGFLLSKLISKKVRT